MNNFWWLSSLSLTTVFLFIIGERTDSYQSAVKHNPDEGENQ